MKIDREEYKRLREMYRRRNTGAWREREREYRKQTWLLLMDFVGCLLMIAIMVHYAP